MNTHSSSLFTNLLSLSQARLADYVELTKPRLVSLVLLSTATGFFLGTAGSFSFSLMGLTLVGTLLVAAGSMSLNEWMEWHEDARMERTMARPIPSGRVHPAEALVFGSLLSCSGLAVLFFAVNQAAFLLAAITLGSYLAAYTPLKRRTSLCTIVGAIPGALPPLIGWAAVRGTLHYPAWVLFAILFLWQMPHFLAIAWIYRKDYANAGFRMLSVEDPDGKQVGRQILLYAASLLPVSLLPTLAGLTGPVYFFSAFALSSVFTILAASGFKQMDEKARPIFRASVLYLSLLLILMVLDKK